MLRVLKPTSPMSVGTWILTAYAPGVVLAAGAEIIRLLPVNFGPVGRLLDLAARPAGLAAAVFAPGVASYTAMLLTDTATPAWHDAHRELPFVFVASAAAASGGLGMVVPRSTRPVRRGGSRSLGRPSNSRSSTGWNSRWACRPRPCTPETPGG